MNRRRLWTLVPTLVCAVAIGALLIGGLSHNVVYFRTVSEAVEARPGDGTSRLRVAGAVVPGSVQATDGQVSFDLTDGKSLVRVRHQGDPPELFADGAPIVSEGHWAGNEFVSDRLMIKHGSEYQPPAVDGDSDAEPAAAYGATP